MRNTHTFNAMPPADTDTDIIFYDGTCGLCHWFVEWVLARDRQAHVLLTKSDKLNRRDSQRVLQETKTACGDTAVTAQLFSAHAKLGFEEARGVMDRWLEAA